MKVKSAMNHRKLYKSKIGADVKFVLRRKSLKEEAKVNAHKAILAASSSVFERMFYGSLKESDDDEVKISDTRSDIFSEFLQFFYLDEVEINPKNIIDVAKLVDKYDVKHGVPVCEQILKESVTRDVVCVYYELALAFNYSNELLKHFEMFICKNVIYVFKTIQFKNITKETLTKILQLNVFCSEVYVFNAAISWATQVCKTKNLTISPINLKATLGDCLTLIRFPVMAATDFTNCMEKYPSLIDHRSCCDILQYILVKRPLTFAKQFQTAFRSPNQMVVRVLKITSPAVVVSTLGAATMPTTKEYSTFESIVILQGSNAWLTHFDVVLPNGAKDLQINTSLNSTIIHGDAQFKGHFMFSNLICNLYRIILKEPVLCEVGKSSNFVFKVKSPFLQDKHPHFQLFLSKGNQFCVNGNHSFVQNIHFRKEI